MTQLQPISITESQCLTATRAFLLNILPHGVEVVRGLSNRVPEPTSSDFVLMTPMGRDRLATNVVTVQDTVFTGSIALTTLNVTDIGYGSISIGSPVLGTGVTWGTVVTALGTGTGGVGTYTVAPSQTVASGKLAAGIRQDLQKTQLKIQLDVHGPNSGDNSQIITDIFRSERGIEMFAYSGFDLTPLFSSDPLQAPYKNGEQQIEERWVVDLNMQINPIVTTPQQFADQLEATVINAQVNS
jgi:hypothetical protein